MKCYFCGHENEVGQTECSICGRNLDDTDPIIPVKKKEVFSKELLYFILFFCIGLVLSSFVAFVLSSIFYYSDFIDFLTFIPYVIGFVFYIISFVYGIKARKKNKQSLLISVFLAVEGIILFSYLITIIAFMAALISGEL